MDKEKLEQLVFLQAVENAIKNPLKDLKNDAAAYFREQYEKDDDEGVTFKDKTKEIAINGEKVGTYSLVYSEPKAEETGQKFYVASIENFAEWFEQNATAEQCREYAAMHLAGFAEWYFAETGEVPDGCVFLTYTVPAEPARFKYGSLRVNAEKVAEAVKSSLPERVTHLLGGGLDG